MARRKQEVQLQREIETQEEWEDTLSKDGLFVIDVYQEWCGPTAGMVGNFRRIKNEIGDDLLKFAIAKTDTIDALEKYRGRCEPCFHFYAGGVLVAVVRGANAPLILRTITEQLAQEHKVIDGSAERKEIKDAVILQLEEMERRGAQAEEEEEEEEEQKEVTVCIIKPDAVADGRTEEIIRDLQDHDIEVLCSEDRLLTEEEAKSIYTHLQDEPYFDDLIKFMTSGPSSVLVLTKGRTGQNIIEEFRDLIGPTAVEEAKTQKPESLRSKYGTESFKNALHGSDSKETAMRELAFFFPDFVAPTVEGKPKLQRTLALVRPDAFKMHRDEILSKINEAGFKVAMQKEIQLSKEQAEDFYKEHKGQEYFEELTTRMTSGPLLALALAREDAIAGWRQMLGPKELDEAKEQAPDSLRAQFAVDSVPINQLHGSDSEDTAKKELEYFFPVEQTVAVIKPDAYATKDEIVDKIHDAGFRIAARKETTLSREMAGELYADHKDKEYYNDLVEHMVSGPTLFMVLSREAAVDGWRSLIGPTDPQQAKEVEPESLRGLYGSDLLKNAVHGSSNPEDAQKSIQKIFGDLHFNKDGTVTDEEQEEPVQEERREQAFDVAPEYGQQLREEEGEQAEEKAEPVQEGGEQAQEEQAQEAQPAKDEDTRPPSAKKAKEEEEAPPEPAQEESKAEEQEPEPKDQEPETKPQEEETKEEDEEEAKPAEDQLPEQQQQQQQQQQQEESKQEESQAEEQKPSTPEVGDDQKPSEQSPAGEQQAQEPEAEKKSEGAPAESEAAQGEAAQGEETQKGEGDEAQSEQKTEEDKPQTKEEEKKPDEEQTT